MNRRNFVLGAIGAAGALAAQSSSDRIRTAVIGVGNRGGFGLQMILQQPDVAVTALCDIKPDHLDKAATLAARDKPKTFSDYRRLLDLKDIDAVYIATPCDLHVTMAVAALQAGKHVYCEKPVGIEPRSIGELVRTARSSKTVFQVGQQMRSELRLRQTIDKIHEGIAGKIIMVKAQRHAGDDLDHNGPSKEWFFNAARSGDVLVEMAVHNLDECNWAIGSRPERAAGFGGTLLWKDDPPGRTNMDGYSLTYDYANGVKLSFTQVFFHPRGMPGGGQYTYVYGEKGAIDVDSATFYPRGRKSSPQVLAEKVDEPRDAHFAAFFECIRTGRKPPADITIGATAALTAILGREAIYQKKVMTWQDLGVEL
jgi:myo-inositol 2-dehydrogenase/D-chiro-inositol 1-dehydrogenase